MATKTKPNTRLYIYQGETFDHTITWLDADGNAKDDITNYTIRMQVRKAYSDSTPVINLDNDQLGGITITDGPAATFKVTITATQTAALTISTSGQTSPPYEKWYYDLELESSGGVVTRILQGDILAYAEVTK